MALAHGGASCGCPTRSTMQSTSEKPSPIQPCVKLPSASESHVKVSCPNCLAVYTVDASLHGKIGRCKKCATKFEIRSTVTEGVSPEEGIVPAVWQPEDVILGIYEVKQVHQGGAMGLVYRIRHLEWDMDLAVKTPKPEILMRAGGEKSFREEAETWVRLGLYPHIVSCFYVRTLGGIPRVFAEYIEGGSLADWIRDGTLYAGGHEQSLARILDVAIQFAWGLHYSHQKGLVHQDVKPGNVMMTPGGIAKVTDFGLSRGLFATGKPSEPSGDSALVTYGGGTPAYFSYEQAEAKAQSDAGTPLAERTKLTLKTDMWSWAVSVLDMFNGEPSCRYGGQLAPQMLDTYLEDAATEEHIPRMPKAIAALLQSCFQHDPALRPKDMLEVAESLATAYEASLGARYPRQMPDPSDALADGLNNLAVSMLDLRNTKEARTRLDEALRAEPQHLDATYNRGLLRWRLGEVTDTELVTELSQARIPVANRQWYKDYLLALVHIERADAESAIQLLQETAYKHPDQPKVREALDLARSGSSGWRHCLGALKPDKGEFDIGQTPKVFCVSVDGKFALTGRTLFTKPFGYCLELWDLSRGRCLQTINETPLVHGADQIQAFLMTSLSAVCLSGNTQLALSATEDGTLQLWNLKTKQRLQTFSGHDDPVNSACLSRDGQFVISASGGRRETKKGDTTIRLWSASTGKYVRILKGHQDRIDSISLSADETFLLSGSADKTVKLWEVSSGSCLQTMSGHTAEVTSVCFRQNHKTAVSGSEDGTIRLWDTTTGKCLRTLAAHASKVSAVSVSKDGRLIFSSGDDRYLRLWECASGRCVRSFPQEWPGSSTVQISADGRLGFSVGEHITRWKLDCEGTRTARAMLCRAIASETALEVGSTFQRELQCAQTAMKGGDCIAAAEHLRTARAQPGCSRLKQALTEWSRLYLKLRRKSFKGAWADIRFQGHTDTIKSIGVTADGKRAASASDDQTIRVWDIETGECIRVLKGHTDGVTSSDLSRDGKHVLSGSFKSIKLWDTTTGGCLQTIEFESPVHAVALACDKRIALSIHLDGTLRYWNLQSASCIRIIQADTAKHANDGCLAVLPDSRLAVSGGNDTAVRVWDVATGKAVHALKRHTEVVFGVASSADGRFALSGSGDKTLKLWDLTTGRRMSSLEKHNVVLCVDVSPDGRHAISGAHDHTVKIWDTSTGGCFSTLEGHTLPVRAVRFTPDCRFALSAGEDKSIQRWFLDWELDSNLAADWSDEALPFLSMFLACRRPYLAPLPRQGGAEEKDLVKALTRGGTPVVAESDFEDLIRSLAVGGFGWLKTDGVRRKLKEHLRGGHP